MLTPYNSTEAMSVNRFASMNHSLKHFSNTGERRTSFRGAQTPDPSEYDTTQSRSESKSNPPNNPDNPGNPGNPRRRRQVTNSSSNPTNKKPWIWQRAYRWCAQCCRKKRTKLSQVHGKKKNFCRRLKDRCKRHHRRKKKKRKRTTFGKEDDVSTRQYEGRLPEIGEPSTERRVWDEKIDISEDPKRGKRRRRRERDLLDSRVPTIRIEDSQEAIKDAAAAVAAGGVDFTKSCCYLCAKNTMALAAAMSKVEKFHMSIQATTKEALTVDKSCSPEAHVRTVQSSVKVRMRDMGTQPAKKRTKRGKLRIRRLYTIIPKLKALTFPKVRTVSCETDRRRNVQCKGRPERCVREHTRTQ